MRFRIWVVVAAIAIGLGGPACAQSSPDPRMQGLEGNWISRDPDVPAPLSPQWKAKQDAIFQHEKDYGDLDNNLRRCLTNGMPMAFRGRLNIWTRPGGVTILGAPSDIRRIYVDGRKHTPASKLKLTYAGESIGVWEGDTLVVDTIGLKRSNEIADGVGNVKLHIVERYTRVGGQLRIETRVEDPYALSKPWEYARTYNPAPQGAITEQYCVQAVDRAFDTSTGAQTFRFDDETPGKKQ